MISKAKLKELAVYKQQKACDEQSVFVVEGVKMCGEALAAKWPVKVVCATNLWLSQHTELPSEAEVFEVDDAALDRLSSLRTPNEVWMLLQRPATQMPTRTGLVLAIDHLQDPGNLGTIIRTAEWFGIKQIVCSEDCVELWNPKVIQATMGSVFRMPIAYTDMERYLKASKAAGKAIFGALLEGENLFKKAFRKDGIIVIGSESHGIRANLLPFITHPITIPRAEGSVTESLNASMAAGIILAVFAME